MPQHRRLDPKRAAGEAGKWIEKDIVRTRLQASVQAATMRQYLSRFRTMEEFRVNMGKDKWTVPLFAMFLESLARAGYKEAEGWRSALWFALACRGEDASFLSSDTVVKMTQGVRLQARMTVRQQGTVTPAMFRDLIAWLRQRKAKHEAALAVVVYEAQLRISEAMNLCVGDAQCDDGKCAALFIRSDQTRQSNEQQAESDGKTDLVATFRLHQGFGSESSSGCETLREDELVD